MNNDYIPYDEDAVQPSMSEEEFLHDKEKHNHNQKQDGGKKNKKDKETTMKLDKLLDTKFKKEYFRN